MTEKDLEDEGVIDEVAAYTGGPVATPTIVIAGQVFMGFMGNEEAIAAALAALRDRR